LTIRGRGLLPRFVVQEHYARSHHFDLRLERDGVLLSWALPKGMPDDPKKKRLAMRVEDHALSHLDHEYPTPVEGGPEGAVRVRIWDRGTYEAEKFSEDEIVVVLRGKRLDGRYAIFRTRDGDWLVHRMVSG
jgi:bifunctional non-homologous end joining protein LigD